MELATEPDIYSPSIDEVGNYIDKKPTFCILKNGLRCPCGSRKDKAYESHMAFTKHIRTKAHQKWLENLNLNKANHYIESENLKENVQQQRLIIAKLEKEVQHKIMTIDFLTQELAKRDTIRSTMESVNDLLDFD